MEQIFSFIKRFDKITKNTDLFIAFSLLAILAVMIVPLPPILLDLALSFSLALSLLILLTSVYIKRALEFTSFPSLLLMTTLFRLGLNVATTRLILTHGHEGPAAAGSVINAFGNFVVGNNYVIGFIIFSILVVINFIVITKGSGRVAEVAARFTLDAMPGKQMSIDAELNAGVINETEARKRRKEIEQEADFYGAMDGASKFVRGDAIAGIIITIINIVGGLLIGVLQKNLDLATAAKYYTMLTIGDGLLAQIPALIISTAAGAIVTRSGSGDDMGKEVTSQLFSNTRAIYTAAGVMAFLALIPGLPAAPFLFIALILGTISWTINMYKKEKEDDIQKKAELEAATPKKEILDSVQAVDMLELEVGYGLIKVVDSSKSGDLLERISSIRKQFAFDLGILVPSVHIRDNLSLAAGEYRFLIKGSKVGGGVLKPDMLMAMDPGNVSDRVEGIATKEPAFGLDAVWISRTQKDKAEFSGYTVVDLPTVMATHITEMIRTHAHELLGRQEASQLIENFKKTHPKVVEDLIPDSMSLGGVVKVMQNLLKEQVSIRDLLTIFETLADDSPKVKDLDVLTENVRKQLSRTITEKYMNDDGEISVMTFDSRLEELISSSLLQTEQGIQLVMDPQSASKMITHIANNIEKHPEIAGQPILLTSPTVRRHISKLVARFIPQLIVLSHSEVAPEARVQSVAQVTL
ncbi:MAG: flagellar biosynthesis protein FlhA [Moraxellaceae bacterium]|nr:flagellar biosynthesis protein FlhA [Pseudobdellovibrionaceae bacterium]